MPTSNTQYITASSGYDGLNQVTVNRDNNLIAENIKNRVSIFGVTGNLNSSSYRRIVSVRDVTGSNTDTISFTIKYDNDDNAVFPSNILTSIDVGAIMYSIPNENQMPETMCIHGCFCGGRMRSWYTFGVDKNYNYFWDYSGLYLDSIATISGNVLTVKCSDTNYRHDSVFSNQANWFAVFWVID